MPRVNNPGRFFGLVLRLEPRRAIESADRIIRWGAFSYLRCCVRAVCELWLYVRGPPRTRTEGSAAGHLRVLGPTQCPSSQGP